MKYTILFSRGQVIATFDDESLTWSSDEKGWGDLLNQYFSLKAIGDNLNAGEGEMPPASVCINRALEALGGKVIAQPGDDIDPQALLLGTIEAFAEE